MTISLNMIRDALRQLISYRWALLVGFAAGTFAGFAGYLAYPRSYYSKSTIRAVDANNQPIISNTLIGRLNSFLAGDIGKSLIESSIRKGIEQKEQSQSEGSTAANLLATTPYKIQLSEEGPDFGVHLSSSDQRLAENIAGLDRYILETLLSEFLKFEKKREVEILKAKRRALELEAEAMSESFRTSSKYETSRLDILKNLHALKEIAKGTDYKNERSDTDRLRPKNLEAAPKESNIDPDFSNIVSRQLYSSTASLLSQFMEGHIGQNELSLMLRKANKLLAAIQRTKMLTQVEYDINKSIESRRIVESTALKVAMNEAIQLEQGITNTERLAISKVTSSVPARRVPIFLAAGSILGLFCALALCLARLEEPADLKAPERHTA